MLDGSQVGEQPDKDSENNSKIGMTIEIWIAIDFALLEEIPRRKPAMLTLMHS